MLLYNVTCTAVVQSSTLHVTLCGTLLITYFLLMSGADKLVTQVLVTSILEFGVKEVSQMTDKLT